VTGGGRAGLVLAIALLGCRSSRPSHPAGYWTIVAHRIPHVSAVTDSAAAAWHGRTLRFATGEASFGGTVCTEARYRFRTAPADSLLGVGFRVSRAALGMADSVSRLGVTEVTCGREPWTAPGGLLIWVGEDRAYTVWDGVFFEFNRTVRLRAR